MSQQKAVQQFKAQIQSIVVKDYGDFRRKANTYLDRLTETIETPKGATRSELNDLKNFIAFKANGEIEQAKAEILKIAQNLEENLH